MTDESLYSETVDDARTKVLTMFEDIKESYGDNFPVVVVSLIAKAKRQDDALIQIGQTVNKIGKGFSATKATNHIRHLLKNLSQR
jgi:hypothetical protein